MPYLIRTPSCATRPRPIEDGVDRLLEEMTRSLGCAPQSAGPEFAPSLDVTESASAWLVRAELPGVGAGDVEVSVTGNVLTVRGEKKAEPRPETDSLRRTERRYGRFARSLEFPSDLDAAKVEAHAKDGVLTITLPKAEASRPTTISVKVG